MEIETTERIFQVFNYDDEVILCNLNHLHMMYGQLHCFGKPVKRIKHYWNYNFETIGKDEIVEIIKRNVKRL